MATSLEVLNKAITRFEENEARVQELANGNETGYYQTNLTPQKQIETWPHFIDRLNDKATGVIAVAENAATRASASATEAKESAVAAQEAARRAKNSENAAGASETNAGQSAGEAKEYAEAAEEAARGALMKRQIFTDLLCGMKQADAALINCITDIEWISKGRAGAWA